MTLYDAKKIVEKAVEISKDEVVIEGEGDIELKVVLRKLPNNTFLVMWLSVDTEHMSVYYDEKTEMLYMNVDHPDITLTRSKQIDDLKISVDDVTSFILDPVLYAKVIAFRYLDITWYEFGAIFTTDL
jgi:hypothetical protein